MAFNLNHINCVYTLSVYVDCVCVYILAEGKQFLGCLLIGGRERKKKEGGDHVLKPASRTFF